MRSGQCPKCSAATVYTKAGGVGDSHIHVNTSFISMPVHVVSFVCTICGYFEHYIDAADEQSAFAPFHLARADMLCRTGQMELARAAYRAALNLTQNKIERDFILRSDRDVGGAVGIALLKYNARSATAASRWHVLR
ncbi:MAG: hypothetical protein ACJ8CR_12600 [Roseiflexaceae bacterium]